MVGVLNSLPPNLAITLVTNSTSRLNLPSDNNRPPWLRAVSETSRLSSLYLLNLCLTGAAMIERFKERIALAPGLPNPNPTTSAWQEPPDSIANIQSLDFPQVTDVVIIGSGVTGCGVAHTLLNHPAASNLRVTILEARSAVSGATGRNGGHLVSDTAGHFQSLVDGLGVERAVQILRFSEANILRLKELAAQLEDKDRDAAELRSLISTSIIMDKETLEPLKQSLKLLQETVTSCTLEQKVIEEQDAFKASHQIFVKWRRLIVVYVFTGL